MKLTHYPLKTLSGVLAACLAFGCATPQVHVTSSAPGATVQTDYGVVQAPCTVTVAKPSLWHQTKRGLAGVFGKTCKFIGMPIAGAGLVGLWFVVEAGEDSDWEDPEREVTWLGASLGLLLLGGVLWQAGEFVEDLCPATTEVIHVDVSGAAAGPGATPPDSEARALLKSVEPGLPEYVGSVVGVSRHGATCRVSVTYSLKPEVQQESEGSKGYVKDAFRAAGWTDGLPADSSTQMVNASGKIVEPVGFEKEPFLPKPGGFAPKYVAVYRENNGAILRCTYVFRYTEVPQQDGEE